MTSLSKPRYVFFIANEQSSADSLFHKVNVKLYLFHFGQHLVLVHTECTN